MGRNKVTLISIFALAMFGSFSILEQFEEAKSSGFISTDFSFASEPRAANFTYVANDLESVGVNEFTFGAKIYGTDFNKDLAQELYNEIETGTGDYLTGFKFDYTLNDSTTANSASYSNDSSLESYVTVVNDIDSTDADGYATNLESGILYVDITIHDNELLQETKVSNITLASNEIFNVSPGRGTTNIKLDVLDYKGEPITLTGEEGNTANHFFIMPATTYVPNSLDIFKSTTDSISFRYELNGTYDETSAIEPIISFEDDDYSGKQRLMSASRVSYEEEVTSEGWDRTTYTYIIDGVANAKTGVKESLVPNTEYKNIRVYIDLTEDDIDGAFLSSDVSNESALMPEGWTYNTVGLDPTIYSYEITDITQTTFDFSIKFNATGVTTTDGGDISSTDWNEYQYILEDNLQVAYKESTMVTDMDKSAPIPGITDLTAKNWTATDDNKIQADFSVTGLLPETEYTVFTDLDTTAGVGLNQLFTLDTDPYDPYDFTKVTLENVDYDSANVTLSMNNTPESIYNVDEFVPSRIRAYQNVEDYNGTDTGIFIADNRLDITYNESASTETSLNFTINNLNEEKLNDGQTYEGIRFVYSEAGYINPASVSDSIDITTKPLEYIDIPLDADGNFVVEQTGHTISTININVPELSSAGSVGTGAEHTKEQYQTVQYGSEGNLQFAVNPEATTVAARETTDSASGTILKSEDVIVNGPTSFVLDLSEFTMTDFAYDAGIDASWEFALEIGTRNDDGTWAWNTANQLVNTTQKLSPEVLSVIIDEDSITQNDITVTLEVKYGNDGSGSLYETFDPTKDIEFKASSLYSPEGEYLTYDYNADSTSTIIDGTEVIGTYEYTLHNLRAETNYTAISTSIQGSAYVAETSAYFSTLNRSMAYFELSDDPFNPYAATENKVYKVNSTYDSVSFAVDIKTGGNYKTVDGEELDDLKFTVKTLFDEKIVVPNFDIEMMRETEIEDESKALVLTEGDYNHEEEEKVSTYEITLHGLEPEVWRSTEISQLIIEDTSETVEGGNIMSTAFNVPLLWSTTLKHDVQFSAESIFEITEPVSETAATTGFEFVFDLNYGGAFMNFDPSLPYSETNAWEVRLFAKELDSNGNPKPVYTEINIEFIEEIEEFRENDTHRLKYAATGLKPSTEYTDIVLTIDKAPLDILDDDPFNKKLEYDGSWTTSDLRSPVLAESFSYSESEVTSESMIFSISVVQGSENSSINEEGYDTFSPAFAYLGYKNDALQDVRLKTSLVSKNEYSITESKATTVYDQYKFQVTGLEAGKTYSQLYFHYNTKSSSRVELYGKSFTTKEFKSPFDPITNPLTFDYNSVTSESFEFSIYINTQASKGEYSGFAPNETVLYSGVTWLNTELVSYEENVNSNGLDTYTYEVNGLKPSTTYGDFSVIINSKKGATMSQGLSSTVVYDRFSYSIPYAYMRTANDLVALHTALWILFIVLLILLITLAIYYYWLWYKKHIALGLYISPESAKLGAILIKIVNASKHKAFKNANVDEMRLYIGGKEIPTAFSVRIDSHGEKTDDYSVIATELVGNSENILEFLVGIKYNIFEISIDGGKTVMPIESVKDRKAKKIAQSMAYDDKYEDAVKQYSRDKKLKKEFKKSKEGAGATALVFINKKATTSTSIRYEAILPEGHPLLNQREIMIEKLKVYYQVDEKLYPFDIKFAGNIGAVYSWDLINLEPATAYVNTHFSVGLEGKKIASLTNYALTRNEEGKQVKLKEAKLASTPKVKGYDLPELKETIEYLGKVLTERTLAISIKKHVQRETGEWIEERNLKEEFREYISKWYKDVNALDENVELQSFILDWTKEGADKKLDDILGNPKIEKTKETKLSVSKKETSKKQPVKKETKNKDTKSKEK